MSRRLAAILSLDVAGYSERMSREPEAALADLNRVLREAVRPAIRAGEGRVVKLMGDGLLAEFPAAGGALQAAARICEALREDPVRLRAGLHCGDVTGEGEDIFGDAVNIAARLQAQAPPGGAPLSRALADMAGGGHGLSLRGEGALRLKGLPRAVEALSLHPGGAARPEAPARPAQDIRFAASADGVRLAWTGIGEGPPLVKAPNFIQHLELDWETVFGPWMAGIATGRRLIRFDSRGNGLSDWDVPEISYERLVDDLEAVFDAAGIARAPVFALSQGCPIAVGFAARRPERVSGLVFYGGFAQGLARRTDPMGAQLAAALAALGRANWFGEYPSVRDHFASLILPGAGQADRLAFADLMRRSISAENFGRFREALAEFDVTELLPQVRCPALVMHSRGDRQQPIEQGRRLAAGMPDARFVAIDSINHVMTLEDPACPVVQREMEAFLAGLD
jgi:class 3 adenylate cyclase/pimeloyl-ACP methyl ester carboxylesterase